MDERQQLLLWRPLLYCSWLTFSRSWYFMILWTGLMSRSEICNLCRSCCLRSYNVKVGCSLMSREDILKKSSDRNDLLPQSMCLCTLRRCAQTWACFDSKSHTCWVSVPMWEIQIWSWCRSKAETERFWVWTAYLFEKEWPQLIRVLQTFLQLTEEKTKNIQAEEDQLHLRWIWTTIQNQLWATRTLGASRRSGWCSQRRLYLFPSCRQGRPAPSFDSCSPKKRQDVPVYPLPNYKQMNSR